MPSTVLAIQLWFLPSGGLRSSGGDRYIITVLGAFMKNQGSTRGKKVHDKGIKEESQSSSSS